MVQQGNKGEFKLDIRKVLEFFGMLVSLALLFCVITDKPLFISSFFKGAFGYGAFIFPLFLLYQFYLQLFAVRQNKEKAISGVLAFAGLMVLLSAFYAPAEGISWYESGIRLNSGGFLCELFGLVFSLGLGDKFAIIAALMFFLLAFVVVYNSEYFSFLSVTYEKKHANSIVEMLSDYNEYGKRRLREQRLTVSEKYTSEQSYVSDMKSGFELQNKLNNGRALNRDYEHNYQSDSNFESERKSTTALPAVKNQNSYQEKPVYTLPPKERQLEETKKKNEDFASDKNEQKKSIFSNIPFLGSSKNKSKEGDGLQQNTDMSNHIKNSENIGEKHIDEVNSLPTKTVEETEKESRGKRKMPALFASKVDSKEKYTDQSTAQIKMNTRVLSKSIVVEEKKSSQSVQKVYKKQKTKTKYKIPPVDLLEAPKISRTDHKQFIDNVIERLHSCFKNFGVDARVTSYEVGPTITMFEVTLGVGVKISKLQNLNDDIALSLAVTDVRISPVEGKTTVGIEVPNESTEPVVMRQMVENKAFQSKKSPLSVVFGKDISGKEVIGDLTSMPHLLVAGATGSGKSVCINTIITSILLSCSPDEVRFIMIDPKQVELSNYNDIPHLIMPVVTDPKQAGIALNWAVQEMERRYNLMLNLRVKNCLDYNNKCKPEEKLPYIVVIIDELSDLMMVAAKQIEDAIGRIAQKARAAGIHLIVATQRPSVDVITGVIKANIPSRIAFSVSSQIDSRTILDQGGAEKLLGKGDMLYQHVSLSRPKRVQGAFVSTDEIERVVDFIAKQNYSAEQIELPKSEVVESSGSGDDEYLEDAIQLVRSSGKASASMLQRRFSIGYNRAARLMDIMEERGIVGPQNGSKPREVL